jgi:hypothetical protein
LKTRPKSLGGTAFEADYGHSALVRELVLMPHSGHSQYPLNTAQLAESSIFAEKTPPVNFIGGKVRPDPDDVRKAGSICNHSR